MTQIGPFPDQKLLKGIIEDLALVTVHAAATIAQLVEPTDVYGTARKLRFSEFAERWRKKFLNSGPNESV
jgi:hypothetical protein